MANDDNRTVTRRVIRRGAPIVEETINDPLVDPTSPTNIPSEETEEPEVDQVIHDQNETDEVDTSEERDSEVENNDPPSEDTDPIEEDTPPNPYSLLGKQFKKDGLLKDDVEIEEDISGIALYARVKKHLEDTTRARVQQEFNDQMKASGINEENIRRWQLFQQGYDPNQLKAASVYGQLKSVPDDSDQDTMLQVIRAYHNDRGLQGYESERILDNIAEEDLAKEFKRSKEHFGRKEKELVAQEQQAQKAIEQQRIQQDTKNRQIIDGILGSQQIGSEKLTPQQAKAIHEDLYEKREKLDIQGVKHDATPFQKFDWMLKNDLTFLLQLYKMYKYKDTQEQEIVTKVKEQVDNDFLSAYEKSKNSKAVKNRKERETDTEDEGRAWRQVGQFGFRK